MARRVLSWCLTNARNLTAAAALAAVSVGFWLYSPPLGLIVPGAVVFASLAFTRLRGGD